ncbi:PucR family transcriptional regulator [Paenibacillus sp. IB182496]|uniref:PucR family transcriptional regulator n=1 Tax=Paenibacillus sabuli TaxID=2772509 RepID=A0A927BWK7_9BACL|nr:PucR family transcriptional regulator [Paenibacillus sabuli]MBD2847070.1 PucR family transcriptional regulator [Paenibacillus sabuli]
MTEEEIQGLMVKHLLNVPHLQGSRLLGGEAGLDKLVSRVNVMEVPDVVDWVRPGEFLVTTGYPFREEPQVLETLIAQLAGKGVAALGIKTKRFIEAIPPSAVEAADRHGLPLIELGPETSFSDVVREVMERVLVAESRYLAVLQSHVQRLSHVLLHGDGLPAFLHHLQQLLRNPVALLDPDGGWMASPEAEPLCAELEAEDGHWLRLREDARMQTSFVPLAGRNVRVYIAEVPDGQGAPFLLLLLEHNREYGIVDTMTMNWAAELAGFEISNEQARRRIEAKYVDQFLQDWMAGRIVSEVDLRLRAEACGQPLPAGAGYVVGIVQRLGADEVAGEADLGGREQTRELQGAARRLSYGGGTSRGGAAQPQWTVLEGRLVVLFPLPGMVAGQGEEARNRAARAVDGVSAASADATDVAESARVANSARVADSPSVDQRQLRLDREVERVLRALRQALPGAEWALRLGRSSTGVGGVPGSFREAMRTAQVARVCRMSAPVVRYEELGVYLLLYRLHGSEELEAYRRMYLAPLLAFDRKQQGAMLQTVATYLQCGCNTKETAERLFLHYNTVTYRLERLRSELGWQLDDPETRLQLQLAIKLHEMESDSGGGR